MDKATKKSAIFIDENVVIHEDGEAEAMLKEKSQLPGVDTKHGIAAVEKSRWEEALSLRPVLPCSHSSPAPTGDAPSIVAQDFHTAGTSAM